jgi:opacity protein-like surface antigen
MVKPDFVEVQGGTAGKRSTQSAGIRRIMNIVLHQYIYNKTRYHVVGISLVPTYRSFDTVMFTKKNTKKALVVALMTALPFAGIATASAAMTSSPWYGGANVAFTSGFSGFGSATGFGIYGGYRLPVHIWRLHTAVEVGYDHFGSMNENGMSGSGYTGTLTGHDETVTAVFAYPVMPRLSVYARAGLAFTSLTYTLTGNGSSGSASGSGANGVFGFGAQYHVTRHIGVRAEYRLTGVGTVNGFSAGNVSSFDVGGTYFF